MYTGYPGVEELEGVYTGYPGVEELEGVYTGYPGVELTGAGVEAL